MKNYNVIWNVNVEIYLQKLKLAFEIKYLMSFLLASMLFTYKKIINNGNIYNTLIFDGAIHAFQRKETKVINLRVIKKNNMYFIA